MILTRSDFRLTRYEMLQDNVEGYRKEISSLREKEQKMIAAAQKQEQTVHTLNEDLRAAKEKLTMAEVHPLFHCFLSCFFCCLRETAVRTLYLEKKNK